MQDAGNPHLNNHTSNIERVEMMEIKTEPTESNKLFFDGENSIMADMNWR